MLAAATAKVFSSLRHYTGVRLSHAPKCWAFTLHWPSENFKTTAEQWDVHAGVYSDPLIATLKPPAICSAAVPREKTEQYAKADAL